MAKDLADFINPSYKSKDIVKQIKDAFKQDPDLPSVAIGDFLTDEGIELVGKNAKRWKHVSVLDRYSYAKSKVRLGVKAFVKAVTGKDLLEQESLLFRHRDFTLLHDEEKQKAGILAFYFLGDWDPEWGGDLVFVKDGDMLGRVAPKKNTLVIVHRKRGVRMFVKYVNHKAGKKGLAILSAK